MLASAIADYRKPIPVSKAVFADPGIIYTVYGQITAINRPFHMIKGGQYQCNRCQGQQYIEYQRPSNIGDEEAPQVMHRMCRVCEEENLASNSRDHQLAMQLHLVRPVPVNAIRIELMGTDEFDKPHMLPVMLFDRLAEDVKVGEYVEIRGKHYSVPSSRSRGAIFRGILYAHDVTYTNRAIYELTDKDIKRVLRFTELVAKEKDKKTKQVLGENNIIRRLVWMYGHHIIWEWEAKEALLFAETSAGPDMIGKGSKKIRRSRIGVGLVGDAGSGKSTCARAILLHDDRNRYESAQGSSGKTMSAIVTKEGGDNSLPVLRTGALAHTKEAVLAINEFGEVPLEEQKHYQDAMEEGRFTVNKQGIHAEIRADSVIVWTSNPKQGAAFSKKTTISLEEIPMRKQILDRTDLLIIMRAITDEQTRREFDRLVLEMEEAFQDDAKRKIIFNYDQYLKIHIMYARRIKPLLTPEVSSLLVEADVRIQSQKLRDGVANAGSNRGLGTLQRLATVVAKLKLHTIITIEDAKYAIEFYNKVNADLQASISVPEDPATLAYNLMVYILQNESNGLAKSLKDLAEIASARDPAVKWYLFQGTKNRLGDVSTNRRLRRVLEMLENLNSNNVKRVRMEPAEFLWIGNKNEPAEEDTSEETGHADTTDVTDTGFSTVQGESQSASHDMQTKMSGHDDTTKPNSDAQGKSGTSATSATSAIASKYHIEDSEEYLILKCMQQAAANYSDAKAQNQESGSLFSRYDLWYHLSAAFPKRQFNADKTDKVIQEQIRKGRVITRAGDLPDRYYLVWRDTNHAE